MFNFHLVHFIAIPMKSNPINIREISHIQNRHINIGKRTLTTTVLTINFMPSAHCNGQIQFYIKNLIYATFEMSKERPAVQTLFRCLQKKTNHLFCYINKITAQMNCTRFFCYRVLWSMFSGNGGAR